ncbi:leucyl/phenylalanyl-tRNA--protein transferase [Patulibacter brassicae]|uniref:Leucyl/phenylalanyl-tRNA--protein transferase n=1 Tax=Patulibacter brassicae TaxID=1705717 RepID=A0ABU4VEN7_9ACTN|nr:leucyl/phenylalanyl-tRNA--protein transferase [Patulibacter brassicae]MDX8150232.1 leucyl/phenylalanyl-tRNA--protein transferase [Patulibacter brassicae]
MESGGAHTDDGSWILDPPGMLFVYEQGAFPMDTRGEDGQFRVAAYRADPRAILDLDAIRLPRTLRRTIPRHGFRLTVDAAFSEVVEHCAHRPGLGPGEVWLTPRLAGAYRALHRWGHARSFEVWDGDALVGGTFGVALGRAHTLESMFHLAPDAGSAAVLHAAVRMRGAGYRLLDVQQRTPHTARLGVREVAEAEFLERLRWALSPGLRPAALRRDAGPADGHELVAAIDRLTAARGRSSRSLGTVRRTSGDRTAIRGRFPDRAAGTR